MQSSKKCAYKKNNSIWSFDFLLSCLSEVKSLRFITFISLFYASVFHSDKLLSAEITVYGFQNIPLMSKLTQVDEKCFLFDTPYGRIIHSFAKGRVKEEEVSNFYRVTLAELGWEESELLKFFRDGEYLRVEIEGLKDGEVGVYFSVRPSQNLDVN